MIGGIFMAVRDDFAKRFTIIKDTYGFSYADLSKILGLRSKSTVNEWIKSKRSFPKEGTLVLISNLFAVSTDWLLGLINTPYNEIILTSLEENYAAPFLKIALNAEKKALPEIYNTTDLRRKNYTHGQRANLIFAALSSYYKIWNITSKTIGKEVDPELLRNYILKIEGIDLLLNRELRTPLWDLEKAFMTHKKAD